MVGKCGIGWNLETQVWVVTLATSWLLGYYLPGSQCSHLYNEDVIYFTDIKQKAVCKMPGLWSRHMEMFFFPFRKCYF